MPATTWAELQRYEAQFDAAHEVILAPFAASPFKFTLYPQQSVDAFTAPRLEHQFTLGTPAMSSHAAQQSVNRRRILSWNFTLLYRFIFDRRKLPAAARNFDGMLRELLAPPAPGDLGAFNSTTLPWLEITALNEIRAFRGIVRDEGQETLKQLDAWESTWAGIFTVRASAMPSV